ncbi:hypothetical protein [Pseudonocardia sp. HH130630-07]|uniref:hypothetical protein n=1 Tax=Pseudonocardia sp. HH130630-07 TaxID=1690815 RepID=UPI000814CB6A|nr:hypothetical protein [Pseudonocardia sp. HH130630-07]ANY08233.1 hypothetical protein AFB00_20325 [Pseudonocardia sp. HH130630-07]
MITFQVPKEITPLPSDFSEVDERALRSRLTAAPEEFVDEAVAVAAYAAALMRESGALYAGVLLAHTEDGAPRPTLSQLIVDSHPLISTTRPDLPFTLRMLREQHPDGHIQPVGTPLGDGFLVLADIPAEDAASGAVLRAAAVHVPLPNSQVVLSLTIATPMVDDLPLHAAILAAVVDTLAVDDPERSARRSHIQSALDGAIQEKQ